MLLSYVGTSLVDGSSIQFTVDGVDFPGPQIFKVVAEEETAITSLDTSQSRCSFTMSTVTGDGIDIATALVFPRDNYGNPIASDVLPLEFEGNQGLTVLDETISFQDDRWTFSVRAGTQTGFATVNVTSGGEPTGISCVIESIEPETPGIGSPDTSTIEVVPNKLAAGSSNTAKVRAYPRTQSGRLIGPSASISVTADGATLQDMKYRGIGLYRGELLPPDLPGLATVTLWDNDTVLTTTTIEIFDPNPAPDTSDGDTADSDSSVSDAQEPMDLGPESGDIDELEETSNVESGTEPEIPDSTTASDDSTRRVTDATRMKDGGPQKSDVGLRPTPDGGFDIATSTDTTRASQGDYRSDSESRRQAPRSVDSSNAGGGCETSPHAQNSAPWLLLLVLSMIVCHSLRSTQGVKR
jgi:hypothetical protein